jgi:hypothetical protein
LKLIAACRQEGGAGEISVGLPKERRQKSSPAAPGSPIWVLILTFGFDFEFDLEVFDLKKPEEA